MKDDQLGRAYSDNEVIFKEGEKGDVMYVLQSGRVRISKKTPSGEVTIAVLEEGDIFGEMALFDRFARSATARALGETRILSVDKKKLFTAINRDSTLVFKIIETMSQRIRSLDESFIKLKEDKAHFSAKSIGVEETCNAIIEETKNFVEAENGSIMLLDDSEKSLHIQAAFGSEADIKLRLSPGEGIAGDVLKTGRAELVNNVWMDSRFKEGYIKISSLLCVPIKYENMILGVINMSHGSEKLFTIDDLKSLHSLGIYASMAIQNSKVFSKLMASTSEVLMHASLLGMC